MLCWTRSAYNIIIVITFVFILLLQSPRLGISAARVKYVPVVIDDQVSEMYNIIVSRSSRIAPDRLRIYDDDELTICDCSFIIFYSNYVFFPPRFPCRVITFFYTLNFVNNNITFLDGGGGKMNCSIVICNI